MLNIVSHNGLKLTARQQEVLHWVIQGKTNQEVGIILGIATATVAKHVEHVLRKLGVETRTAAARVATEHGFDFDGAREKRHLHSKDGGDHRHGPVATLGQVRDHDGAANRNRE